MTIARLDSYVFGLKLGLVQRFWTKSTAYHRKMRLGGEGNPFVQIFRLTVYSSPQISIVHAVSCTSICPHLQHSTLTARRGVGKVSLFLDSYHFLRHHVGK